jgi:hypothetical protein
MKRVKQNRSKESSSKHTLSLPTLTKQDRRSSTACPRSNPSKGTGTPLCGMSSTTAPEEPPSRTWPRMTCVEPAPAYVVRLEGSWTRFSFCWGTSLPDRIENYPFLKEATAAQIVVATSRNSARTATIII